MRTLPVDAETFRAPPKPALRRPRKVWHFIYNLGPRYDNQGFIAPDTPGQEFDGGRT